MEAPADADARPVVGLDWCVRAARTQCEARCSLSNAASTPHLRRLLAACAAAFQWFDAQDYEGRPLKRNPHRGSPHVGSTQQQVPVIRLWGITGEGNSVCCNVHGFTPYFYCSAPVGFNMKKGLAEFRTSLNRMVLAGNTHGFRCADAVLGVNAVSKKSIFGYAVPGSPPMRCLQVHVASQRFIASARGILERGFVTPGCGPSPRSYQCFEAKVSSFMYRYILRESCSQFDSLPLTSLAVAKLPFVLRCLIDCDIVGANWLELPAATYSVRPADGSDSELGLSTETHSQCEPDVVFNSIVSHKPDGEWMKLAPIRVLSYDIECKGRKGHFPEASQDPVIQIASILTEHGRDTPIDRNVHVLDTCLPIIGARVVAHRDERELLKAWTTYVVESDPDIITGYNSNNFDMPYILVRCPSRGSQQPCRSNDARARCSLPPPPSPPHPRRTAPPRSVSFRTSISSGAS